MKMSSFTDYTSVIRIPSKLTINRKNDNDVTMCRYDVIVKLFWRCFVSLVKFSYCFKFHINIITGSGVMTISFYKGLTKNLEIGHSPVWVFPKIWRRGGDRNTKFDSNALNEMLRNAAKCHSYDFYSFWVIKVSELSPTPTQIRVNVISREWIVTLASNMSARRCRRIVESVYDRFRFVG